MGSAILHPDTANWLTPLAPMEGRRFTFHGLPVILSIVVPRGQIWCDDGKRQWTETLPWLIDRRPPEG
jgi:hypothetical protein